MEIFITIVIINMIIFGTLCGFWANWKGRKVPLAVFLGACFGWMALLGYMLAGESELKKSERIRKAVQQAHHDK